MVMFRNLTQAEVTLDGKQYPVRNDRGSFYAWDHVSLPLPALDDGSYTIEAKGVGQTPDKAYLNALKNVHTNDPGFKAMVDKGKAEIIDYYNTNCNLVISDAQTMVKRHEFSEAIDLLSGVPSVCEECYHRAQQTSVDAYQAWTDHVCDMALNKAQAAWATRDAKAAADALELVPADGACAPRANALIKEIAAKLDAKERQEWDFKMQQYEDRMAAQPAQTSQPPTDNAAIAPQRQQALRKATNAVADQPEEVAKAPAKPKYQVKGKWFK